MEIYLQDWCKYLLITIKRQVAHMSAQMRAVEIKSVGQPAACLYANQDTNLLMHPPPKNTAKQTAERQEVMCHIHMLYDNTHLLCSRVDDANM